MTIHVASERQVIQEAAQVLMAHMSPAKATRFWASWQPVRTLDGGRWLVGAWVKCRRIKD